VLQHAIAALKRDGFVRSDGRRGLFVTENPPHLFQYGLVMPSAPGDPGWCQLMTALNNEAYRIERTDPQRRFRFYYGVEAGPGAAKSLAQLGDDLRNHRLAGLVIHYATAPLLADVLTPDLDVPRIYLWADQASGVTPCLTTNGGQLIERSLRLLKERGRRRVAVVHMGGTDVNVNHAAMFSAAGLAYHAPWVQWVGRSDPAVAERLVALLMDYPPEARPDALIVTDDNLVPHVSSGLVAAGVRVGEELELVAHCNWPWPPRSVLPMVRIGFDVRAVLQGAIDAITRQREGKAAEPYQRVPALFEWEIAAGGGGN
jgi:DNA-binding LacI/PurR family transcriptional regulator